MPICIMQGGKGKTTMSEQHFFESFFDQSVGCSLLGGDRETMQKASNYLGAFHSVYAHALSDMLEVEVQTYGSRNSDHWTFTIDGKKYDTGDTFAKGLSRSLRNAYHNTNGELTNFYDQFDYVNFTQFKLYLLRFDHWDDRLSRFHNLNEDDLEDVFDYWEFAIVGYEPFRNASERLLPFIRSRLIVNRQCLQLDGFAYFKVGEGSITPVYCIRDTYTNNRLYVDGRYMQINPYELVVGYERIFLDSLITVAHSARGSGAALNKGGSTMLIEALASNNMAQNILMMASIYLSSLDLEYVYDLDMTALTDGHCYLYGSNPDGSFFSPNACLCGTRTMGYNRSGDMDVIPYFIGDITFGNKAVCRCKDGQILEEIDWADVEPYLKIKRSESVDQIAAFYKKFGMRPPRTLLECWDASTVRRLESRI